MEKVIRGGDVAVLFSPGFGAGWYSWHGVEQLLFDPRVVELLEQGRRDEIADYCAGVYGEDHYYGGAEDLIVAWIPVGVKFRVHEYDGAESLVLESQESWIVA